MRNLEGAFGFGFVVNFDEGGESKAQSAGVEVGEVGVVGEGGGVREERRLLP